MNINVGYDAVRGMTFRRMSRDLARDTGNMNDPVVMVTEVEIPIMSLKGDDFLYTYACNNKLIPIEDASVTFYIVDGEDTVRKPKWLAYYNKNENRRAGYKLNTDDISAIKKQLETSDCINIQKLLLWYRESLKGYIE